MEINKPISITIGIVVIFGLSFLLLMPEYKVLSGLSSQVSEKNAEYEAKKIYYASIEEDLKKLADRKDVLDNIDSALPSDASFAPIVNFFNQKGTESGMVIKSVAIPKVSNP